MMGGKGGPNPTVIFLLFAFCLNMFFFYEASQLRHETENLGDALKSMQKRLENTRRSLDRARNSLNQSRLDALEEKTRMENETANLLDEKQEALEENLGLIKEKEELERRLAVSENALAKHAHDQGTKAVSGGAGFDGCRVHVDWTVKAGTSLPRVKVSKERVLNEKSKQECKEKRLMPGDKFDVVVAWINMSEAGYIDWPPLPEGKPHGDGARGRPYKGIGRNRIPNSELIFGLRSMAKWGMMERVNRIYILYDDARQGPPQFLNGLQTKVRPVPHSELMGGTLFIDRVRRFHVVLAYLHHIHGLLDHFLYVNDDMMLTAPFDMGKLYNEKTGMIKQYIGGGGTGNPAAKKGRAYMEKNHGVKWKGADNHCPIFVRTCLMAEMEALWGDDLYKCAASPAPPLCEFDSFHFNSMVQNYAVHRGVGEVVSNKGGYCSEVHGNNWKDSEKAAGDLTRQLATSSRAGGWLNLQGNGISEEYAVSPILRSAADEWYFSTFPNKPDWENDWETF